jgi:Tol biopolymer transport system component
MKKFVLSSIVLFLFSIAIIVFQISCQKEVSAQSTNYVLPPATTSTLGGVIVGSGLSINSNGVLSVNATTGGNTSQLNKIVYIRGSYTTGGSPNEIWIANYDGTNNTRVNVQLPSGIVFDGDLNPALSPDGKKIFFTATSSSDTQKKGDIYSCNVDGSNVVKIIDRGGGGNYLIMSGAY